MAFLMEDIKASNTFLTVKNGDLKFILRSTDGFEDFGSLDESGRRTYLTKTGAVECKYKGMCSCTRTTDSG